MNCLLEGKKNISTVFITQSCFQLLQGRSYWGGGQGEMPRALLLTLIFEPKQGPKIPASNIREIGFDKCSEINGT